MTDEERLIELNRQFIDGFRLGSMPMVDAVLAPDFVYLDGVTGEIRDRQAYVGTLTGPIQTLAFDEVGVQRWGDVAIVTGRTTRDGTCIHGCLWPLPG
jgi:hypothetical protein